MDKLPPELIDRISSFLEPEDLKQTLLLSKAFRFPAEKYSGVFEEYSFSEPYVRHFEWIFSGHRLSYLRKLDFHVDLPSIEENFYNRDNMNDLADNDESFTRQIMVLFSTLNEVDSRAGRYNRLAKLQLRIWPPQRDVLNDDWEPDARKFLSWRVHLLDPEALIAVPSVRSLDIAPAYYNYCSHGPYLVKLDYRIIIDLAVKLPALEFLGCRIGHNDWFRKSASGAANLLHRDWARPRRDTRSDFAN